MDVIRDVTIDKEHIQIFKLSLEEAAVRLALSADNRFFVSDEDQAAFEIAVRAAIVAASKFNPPINIVIAYTFCEDTCQYTVSAMTEEMINLFMQVAPQPIFIPVESFTEPKKEYSH